jgi:hypothetical protein
MFQKHTSFSIANVRTWSYKLLHGNNFRLKNLRRSSQFIEWHFGIVATLVVATNTTFQETTND